MSPRAILFWFLILGINTGYGQINKVPSTLAQQVDSIVEDGIKQKAFPGAQVLVAHKGIPIFHKTYGWHTYDSLVQVQTSDLYDLASVTKILGPLPALMKLVEEGVLDLDQPFSKYYSPWKKYKDKKTLTLREILAHQAGLTPYIVFLNSVSTKKRTLKRRFVRKVPSKRFSEQAYEGIYVKNRFYRKVFRQINRSKVSPEKVYRYSGLSFLLYPRLIEAYTGEDYETYLKEHFYAPIGAEFLGYNPRNSTPKGVIVPTEYDTLFRHTLTRGWVHDENAALLGGVSGNAGLFGTANAVFKMMQFYQDYGRVGEQQLLKKETVQEFARIQFPENDNRRGLGFDKPLIGNDTLPLQEAYPAPSASPKSFGHAGFTGTFVWADPEHELVFVFLSNRVHPYRSHRKLYELNIRPKLHQLFYEAIK